MNILVIDNTFDQDCWGSKDLVKYVITQPKATAWVRRGPHNDLPDHLDRFDKIIISGSRATCLEVTPWVQKLDRLIRKGIEAGKPILGVCFGHQAIVRAVGGVEHLRRGKNPEFGWSKIKVVSDSILLSGLEKEFYSFSAHYEEVSHLPAGLEKIAESELCNIQGFELKGKPVFGIQFHPEKDLLDSEKTFLEKRKSGDQKILINAKNGKKLYDSKVGERIFDNFFRI